MTTSPSWQDALSQLAGERARAEQIAAIVKRFGDEATIARAGLIYAEGRGAVDALVTTLGVALADGAEADAAPTIEARVGEAVAARERLAAEAEALVARTEGEKEVFSGLVGAAFGALVAAAIALWQQRESEDALRRQTIAARLDGLRWRAFDEIGP